MSQGYSALSRTLMLAVLASTFCLSAFAADPVPTFVTSKYSIANSPGRTVIAEFNRDGLHDTATPSGTDVSVRLGIGNGQLGTEKRVAVGLNAKLIDAIDFNSDGNTDLVVTGYASQKIAVLLGKGDGTFDLRTITAPGFAGAVVIGDFNKDGKPDFIVEIATLSLSALYFYRGNGDGTFTPSVAVSSDADAVSLLSADLNRDGRADLVEIFEGGAIAVYAGNGNGTFTFKERLFRPGTLPGGGNVGGVLGDFNNDGVPDLAVTVNVNCGEGCSGYTTIESWLNDRAGHFSLYQSIVPVNEAASSPVVGDFDNDRNIDIAYTDFSYGFKLAIARGTGIGSFRPPVISESYTVSANMAVSDMDNDGLADIVATTHDSGLSVSLNRTVTPTCAAPTASSIQARICRIANGSTRWSPFVIEAVGNGPTEIARMELWFNNVVLGTSTKVHQVFGDRFLHTVSMPVGSYRVVVAAYDRPGKKGTIAYWVNVKDGPCESGGNDRSVTVCSPGNQATIQNPLRIRAAAQDSRPVTAMQVYIGGVKHYQANNVSKIDFSTGLFLGPQRVTVKAWDALGSFSRTFTVNVISGCPKTGPNRSINICSPVDGQTVVGGYVPIFASAVDSLHVDAMEAYVDGVVRHGDKNVSTLEFGTVVTKGTHRITIKAWDAQGSFSKTVYVTYP